MRLFGIAEARQAQSAAPRGERFRKLDEKARWYLPAAVFFDVAGVALPLAAVFSAAREARALGCAVVAAVAWLAVAAVRRRYAQQQLGESGAVRPVVRDWLVLLGTLAVLRAAVGESSHPAVALVALLPSVPITVASRKLTHRHLLATRREAQSVRRVLVIGEAGSADDVVEHLARRTDHAFVVVGVCTVGEGELVSGAPVCARLASESPRTLDGDSSAVLDAADALGADLIFVAPGQRMSGERLRLLSWALHDRGRPLAVLPGLTEVSGRRVRLTSAAGLTLMHIAPPPRGGLPAALKSATDRVGALALIVALAPLFAALALAVRIGSPGPVIHRQKRIGMHSAPFPMWKFRTMIVDAERLRGQLDALNETDGHMFKLRRDPRVTAVGRFLRRYSLDELPQLFNVLRGQMSLVGPRPPLPEEVAGYNEVEMRRLAVKPGLTGLWQVSGRSDLSWDETVALDLRYIDNWSYMWDLDVLARTARAVVEGRGAY